MIEVPSGDVQARLSHSHSICYDNLWGRTSAQRSNVRITRSCVFSELPDVVAAQRAIRAMPQARLLAGMSYSAGAGTTESGHLVPNRPPSSSSVLVVGISHNRPATFEHSP